MFPRVLLCVLLSLDALWRPSAGNRVLGAAAVVVLALSPVSQRVPGPGLVAVGGRLTTARLHMTAGAYDTAIPVRKQLLADAKREALLPNNGNLFGNIAASDQRHPMDIEQAGDRHQREDAHLHAVKHKNTMTGAPVTTKNPC